MSIDLRAHSGFSLGPAGIRDRDSDHDMLPATMPGTGKAIDPATQRILIVPINFGTATCPRFVFFSILS